MTTPIHHHLGVSFVHAEAHFECNLVVLYFAVPHVPTNFADLEPVDVAQSLGCTRNRGFDCITSDVLELPTSSVFR